MSLKSPKLKRSRSGYLDYDEPESESSKKYKAAYEKSILDNYKPPLEPSRGRRYSQKISEGIASRYPNFGGKRRTNKKRSRRSRRRRQ